MPQSPKLNTTAYSLLGMISKRPWSAYELTEFMGRSIIRYILPRTRSQLYNEPKKLAKLGLIEMEKSSVNNRDRTLYRITPAGRQALEEWLDLPSDNVKVEHKVLLKFYLVDPDDHRRLKLKAAEMRTHAIEQLQLMQQEIGRIVEQGVVLPTTAVAASMASQFGVEEIKARLNWLDNLDKWLEELPEESDREVWALEHYKKSQQQVKRLLKKYQS